MKRRAYSLAFRARALKLAAHIGNAAAARKVGVGASLIHVWRQRAGQTLPTVAAKGGGTARALRALTYACPHCGRPVKLP